jgi:Tfp pilus assembly protein FimV
LALGLVVVAAQAGAALGGLPLASPERRSTASSASSGAASGTRVIVRPGDSLWSLAARLAPGEDLRPIVDELSSARDGAPLLPGEIIRLPL